MLFVSSPQTTEHLTVHDEHVLSSQSGSFGVLALTRIHVQETKIPERPPCGLRAPSKNAAAAHLRRAGAQVVLPDGKDAARDVVVFLDAMHAGASEEEAAQRGAVAALQRVAGERSLHRVLPHAYRDLWQALGVQARACMRLRLALAPCMSPLHLGEWQCHGHCECNSRNSYCTRGGCTMPMFAGGHLEAAASQSLTAEHLDRHTCPVLKHPGKGTLDWGSLAQAEERAARQVRQAAAAEARKGRERARRAAEARRRPTTVVMSEHQRRMVEGVLAQLRAPPGAAPDAAGADAADGDAGALLSLLRGWHVQEHACFMH